MACIEHHFHPEHSAYELSGTPKYDSVTIHDELERFDSKSRGIGQEEQDRVAGPPSECRARALRREWPER